MLKTRIKMIKTLLLDIPNPRCYGSFITCQLSNINGFSTIRTMSIFVGDVIITLHLDDVSLEFSSMVCQSDGLIARSYGYETCFRFCILF